MSSIATPQSGASARPRATSVRIGLNPVILVGTAVVALLLYYFIGVDQGATSVFGRDTHIHELVHDARHFLGFPCH